jgi:hypothetical protein
MSDGTSAVRGPGVPAAFEDELKSESEAADRSPLASRTTNVLRRLDEKPSEPERADAEQKDCNDLPSGAFPHWQGTLLVMIESNLCQLLVLA